MIIIKFFQKLKKFLSWKKIEYISSDSVKFELEEKRNGKHIINVYWKKDKEWEKIKDPLKMGEYGFRLEKENKVYLIDPKVQQIVWALESLNPKTYEDGSLELEIIPPILDYLRSKKEVKEGERSKRLKIFRDKEVERGIKIDYLPTKGLKVEFGYKLDNELIPPKEVKITPDKKYIRRNNEFYPLSKKKLNEKIEEIFSQEKIEISIDKIPEFFKRDLAILKANFPIIFAEEAKKITIVEEPFRPKVLVLYNKEKTDWLEFKIEYQTGKWQIPHNIFQKIKDNYLQLDNYTWVKVDRERISKVEEELKNLGAEIEEEKIEIPIYQFSSIDEFLYKIGGEKIISQEFQKFLKDLEGFREDRNFNPGKEILEHLEKEKVQLRPYQRGGIHWLHWLSQHRLHGILADEMGLGKTLQVCITLRLAYEKEKVEKPSLVICPKPVMETWRKEIKRVFPALKCEIYHGPYRNPEILFLPQKSLIITTYETVKNDFKIFSKVIFFFLILDEATKIKNPSAKRTKIIKTLKGIHRIALTGTPIENQLRELWSIFDFLMPKFLGRYEEFQRKFEIPIIKGDEKAKNNLIRKIKPFVMRRVKEDLKEEFPQKIEHKEFCELTPEQKILYRQILESYHETKEFLKHGKKLNYINILTVLNKLKEVCDHPALITGDEEKIEGRSEKFDRFLELIEEIISGGNQVLLFSQYLKSLNLFEKIFQKRKISYLRLDGKTLNPAEIINKFNTGKSKILLCSLRASSYGINLPAASYVLHFDRWWNPAVEDQATDRAHRIDSKCKFLHIYYILTKGTLEEKIDQLIAKKRKLAKEIIDAPLLGIKDFSREELLELLTPSFD